MTKPSQSLCSDEVYYILVFYVFIQFLVGFYLPECTIFRKLFLRFYVFVWL